MQKKELIQKKKMIERSIESIRTRIDRLDDMYNTNPNGSLKKKQKQIEVLEFIFDVLKFYESYIEGEVPKKKQVKPVPDNIIELPFSVQELVNKYNKEYQINLHKKYSKETDQYIVGYEDGIKQGRRMMLEYILKRSKHDGDYIL